MIGHVNKVLIICTEELPKMDSTNLVFVESRKRAKRVRVRFTVDIVNGSDPRQDKYPEVKTQLC